MAGGAIADVKAMSTGATAAARDPCTDNFRSPASKHQTVISKLWQVLRPGQLKLLPITHIYMYSMCMGNGFSWIFRWRWWQWIDGRRALLGTDALRDRYVVFPKSAMICVACCNLIALWHSSFICIFGALPDVYCTASSIGSTAVSHIALHVLRTHAYMES